MKKHLFTYWFSFLLTFQIAAQDTLVLKPNMLLGKDASIWSNNVNGNYGNARNLELYTWTNQGNLGVKRAFILFNLSSLPTSAIIDSAHLKLFYDPTNNINYQTHSGNNSMEVKRVNSPWIESTLTWSNQPTTTNLNTVIVPSFTSNTQDYIINVGDLVKDMISNGNNGFMIKMQNEISPYRATIFASSDHPNSNLHPELVIYSRIATDLANVKSKDFSNQLIIYPMPSNGVINLAFKSANMKLSNFTVDLISITGASQSLGQVEPELDLSNQGAGIYFLRFTDKNNNSFFRKIILK